MSTSILLPSSAFQAALPDLAVLRIEGADAGDFLHGQLTQDVKTLAPGQARLAAYCTAKGRMLATLVFWRTGSEAEPAYEALVGADVAEALVKRLRMYVLRAKVTLAPLAQPVAGVWADGPVAGLPAPWQVLATDDGRTWIGAPAAPEAPARWWCVGAPPEGVAAGEALAWHAQQIQAGLPWVVAATQELLTPQMANLDLIGGLDFTKGCYPGQEVVARAHYRGKQKRRTLLGRAAAGAHVAPGTDVYDARHTGEPIGRVINVAATGAVTHLLFEAPFETAAETELRLGAPDGTPFELVALPYPFDET